MRSPNPPPLSSHLTISQAFDDDEKTLIDAINYVNRQIKEVRSKILELEETDLRPDSHSEQTDLASHPFIKCFTDKYGNINQNNFQELTTEMLRLLITEAENKIQISNDKRNILEEIDKERKSHESNKALLDLMLKNQDDKISHQSSLSTPQNINTNTYQSTTSTTATGSTIGFINDRKDRSKKKGRRSDKNHIVHAELSTEFYTATSNSKFVKEASSLTISEEAKTIDVNATVNLGPVESLETTQKAGITSTSVRSGRSPKHENSTISATHKRSRSITNKDESLTLQRNDSKISESKKLREKRSASLKREKQKLSLAENRHSTSSNLDNYPASPINSKSSIKSVSNSEIKSNLSFKDSHTRSESAGSISLDNKENENLQIANAQQNFLSTQTIGSTHSNNSSSQGQYSPIRDEGIDVFARLHKNVNATPNLQNKGSFDRVKRTFGKGKSKIEQIFTLKGHEKSVLSVTAGMGKLFSGAKDRSVKIWDIERHVHIGTYYWGIFGRIFCGSRFSSALDLSPQNSLFSMATPPT